MAVHHHSHRTFLRTRTDLVRDPAGAALWALTLLTVAATLTWLTLTALAWLHAGDITWTLKAASAGCFAGAATLLVALSRTHRPRT